LLPARAGLLQPLRRGRRPPPRAARGRKVGAARRRRATAAPALRSPLWYIAVTMSLGVDLVLAGFAAGLLVLLATIDPAYGLISDVSLHILRGGRSERRVAFFKELMEHQERFRMALQLGIQVATIALAAIAVHAAQQLAIKHPVLVGFVAALVV